MENSNIENIMNEFMPFAIKGLVLVGIVVFIIGMVNAIYRILKHKDELKPAVYTILMGGLISFSAVVTDFMCHFEINYSSFKWQIPFASFLGIGIWVVLLRNGTEKSK